MRDKAVSIVKNLKYDGYQRGFASMVYKLKKKKKQTGGAIQKKIMSNKELAEERHKPIIKKI